MPTMARLMLEDAYLPLTRESRAMLIQSLREIIVDLDTYGRVATQSPSVFYIQAPQLRMARPIGSQDCGPDPVGCDG